MQPIISHQSLPFIYLLIDFSSCLSYLSIVLLPLLTLLLRLLHLTYHTSLVLPLKRFLNVSQSPDANYDLDPIPTARLQQCSHILHTFITNIIKLPISTGIFRDQLMSCSVHPRLNKSNLDKDDLSSYRLSFLSKLTERVVKLRLFNYLSTNNLFNSFLSAYINIILVKQACSVRPRLAQWHVHLRNGTSTLVSTLMGVLLSVLSYIIQ